MPLPDYSLAFYLLAALAILLAGISKGGFGAVAGGLAVPLMSIVSAPPEAAVQSGSRERSDHPADREGRAMQATEPGARPLVITQQGETGSESVDEPGPGALGGEGHQRRPIVDRPHESCRHVRTLSVI